jgi:hypothetical protein
LFFSCFSNDPFIIITAIIIVSPIFRFLLLSFFRLACSRTLLFRPLVFSSPLVSFVDLVPLRSPAGASAATQAQCTAGYYCPSNVAEPIACPMGAFCPYTVLNAQVVCTPGQFCSSTGLTSESGYCTAGYYCPAGSSSATQLACAAGSYCPGSSSSATVCEAGNFCPTANLTGSTMCPAAQYCAGTGLTRRSGFCTAGYYCPAGSSAATQAPCTPGYFCPAAAAAPSPCTAGYYCDSTGLAAVAGPCASGYYCPAYSVSATQTQCTSGNYWCVVMLSVSFRVVSCFEGQRENASARLFTSQTDEGVGETRCETCERRTIFRLARPCSFSIFSRLSLALFSRARFSQAVPR